MRALARHLQAVRDRSSDSPPRLDLPTVTRAHSWTFRCKPLMSNAQILAQLVKFARDNNAETMSLNHRVPGSSRGAPTIQSLQTARFRYDAKKGVSAGISDNSLSGFWSL